MRIPRKYIIRKREFLQSLYSIKYVHFRDIHKTIDSTNFQICTKVDFKAVSDTHNNIRETWGRLIDEHKPSYYYKSKTGSQYFIDANNNVYRFSNHWGAVASCEWTREGKGQLAMSVFESGDWEIGIANLKDFKIFRRNIDRKQDKIINPDWVTEMMKLIPTSEKLRDLKYNPEFQNLPNEDKQLIGENYGMFKKELSYLEL